MDLPRGNELLAPSNERAFVPQPQSTWLHHALQRITLGEVAWIANSRLPRLERSLSLESLGA